MDSKYSAGDSLTDYIQLRGYAKDNITLTPYAHMYAAVRFAQTLVKQRALKGSSYVMACPLDTVNDTEIYIYDASRLASVGDLSGLKVGLADFSRATKLQEIKVGDSDQSYTNGNLTNLVLGNNTLLRVLDARNCVNLAQPVDLSGCINIEELYFEGTAITGLNLPNGGIIEVLHLPATVTNLTIRNQQKITDFELNSYSQITTLRLENASIDGLPVFMGMANNGRVRLLGVNWETETYEEAEALLNKLFGSRGLDESGNNTQLAQVSGDYHASVISDYHLEEFENYPDLNVTYDSQIGHRWLLNKYLNDEIDAYEDDQLIRVAPYAMCGRHGTVDFPSVEAIGTNAFSYSYIPYAYFPEVASAGTLAVGYCSELTYAIFPKLNVDSVFLRDCPKLIYLEIFGGNLTAAGLFNNIAKLQHFIIRDNANVSQVRSSYSNNPIAGTSSTVSVLNVYVPSNMISAYKSATNWSSYFSNGYITFKALEDYTVDGTVTGEFDYELINLEVHHGS